jgi:hypothetical protein
MEAKNALTIGIVVLTAITVGWVVVEKIRGTDPFQDEDLLHKNMKKPTVWIYLNNSDVNSRSWYDFMGRSSRAISLPFLNLCYESAVKHTSEHFHVEVIGGLADLAGRLGGWQNLPETTSFAWTVL